MLSENNDLPVNDLVYGADNGDLFDLEIELLLDAVNRAYGYDFRNYSKAHLKRRIMHRLKMSSLATVTDLQKKLLWEKNFYRTFLQDLSINVTEMFRDPSFYKVLREKVIPVLSTYAHIKVWLAGCSTGEEVYSLAILLKEEGLLPRTRIYATDFNKNVLETAKQGIYKKQDMELYESNYNKSGGESNLSDYYTAKYGSVMFDKSLAKNVVFADHNLVTDGVFAEVNMVFCRNVLIYFDKILQNKVLNLFSDSLTNNGFLCLGTKESIRFTQLENSFSVIDKKNKIYKKGAVK
ncbi:MAG: protein-glutamate O-methyltransferase CheR [Prolixibacteraceae bacterium]|nr:protein-glutamate O-methyltransferase CheR [Prolixibacteraceae bacterium]MBN2773698.1 protein-glutamate O-methyltransferase CheR [Prolixibacteraceae bacterium]